MTMLRIEQLTCMAGYRPLFEAVDASLNRGEWISLTGPNGTGKTTLLRALAGLVRPVKGQILWHADAVSTVSVRWRSVVHYLGHATALKDNLTTAENLGLQLTLDHGSRPDSAQLTDLLERVELKRRRDLPVARLSAGQKRRVQLARLLASKRPVWLLDEPANALDTNGEQLLGEAIEDHLQGGGCAVIATHQPLPIDLPSIPLNLADHARRRNAAQRLNGNGS